MREQRRMRRIADRQALALDPRQARLAGQHHRAAAELAAGGGRLLVEAPRRGDRERAEREHQRRRPCGQEGSERGGERRLSAALAVEHGKAGLHRMRRRVGRQQPQRGGPAAQQRARRRPVIEHRRAGARPQAMCGADRIDLPGIAAAEQPPRERVAGPVPAPAERARIAPHHLEAGGDGRGPAGEERHRLQHHARERQPPLLRDDPRGEREDRARDRIGLGGERVQRLRAALKRGEQDLVHHEAGVGDHARGDLVGPHRQPLADRGVARQDRGGLEPCGAHLGGAVLGHGEHRPVSARGERPADRNERVEVAERADRGEDDPGHRRRLAQARCAGETSPLSAAARSTSPAGCRAAPPAATAAPPAAHSRQICSRPGRTPACCTGGRSG